MLYKLMFYITLWTVASSTMLGEVVGGQWEVRGEITKNMHPCTELLPNAK